jgi:hypothetical protein
MGQRGLDSTEGSAIVVRKSMAFAAVLLVLASATVFAQWRGLGRAVGKVVDEAGAPVAEATVRADLLGVGGTTLKTNAKGEWILNGVARGEWSITVAKIGMVTQKTKVAVQEMGAPASLKTTLKKAPDQQ